MLALMPFLWDNYLELSAADDIFLIGVGKAYAGIKELLLARCKYPCVFSESSHHAHMPFNSGMQGPDFGHCQLRHWRDL